MVRRTIEAFFHKSEPGNDLNLLLLDWSKAFDRVDTMALTDALLAFGIGENSCRLLSAFLRANSGSSGSGATLRRPATRRRSEFVKAVRYRLYYL